MPGLGPLAEQPAVVGTVESGQAEAGHGVHVLVGRDAGAAILEDHHFIVPVMGLARAGMDDAVGRYAAHYNALDAVRATMIGKLVLGSGFDPRDLVAYGAGVALAGFLTGIVTARGAGRGVSCRGTAVRIAITAGDSDAADSRQDTPRPAPGVTTKRSTVVLRSPPKRGKLSTTV